MAYGWQVKSDSSRFVAAAEELCRCFGELDIRHILLVDVCAICCWGLRQKGL